MRVAGRVRFAIAGAVAAGIALAGCDSTVGGAGTPLPGETGSRSPAGSAPTSQPPPTSHPPRRSAGPCGYAETEQTLSNPDDRDVGLPPDPNPTPATGTQQVALATNRGLIVFTLDRAKAPCAVQSFLYLTGKGFFNNTPCPRVSSKARDGLGILQCGDPSGTTGGGPTYRYREENLQAASYTVGVVAMANGGPGTTGSQFFVIHEDATGLGRSYSVIGAVTVGLDVVQKVATAGNDASNPAGGGRPNLPITIGDAKIH
jgi:peptidyl-prolyl cis-trans isomerase B (cyclophilin B)